MRDVDGSVAQDYCPRAGHVSMRKADPGKKPERYTLETRCKSWRCKPCKRAKISVMSERIRQCCKSAVQPYFVSVTYGISASVEASSFETQERYKTAVVRGASKDWKEFCRRYNREYKTKLRWMRIPELTKKGMLHFHLVIDGMPTGRSHRCATKMGDAFLADVECGCLSHAVSRVWADITGWFVVDVRPVTNPEGIGTYLGGYLTKMTEKEYEWLASAGMVRRIECSRGFGRLPKLIRPVGIGGYDRVDFQLGRGDPYEVTKTKAKMVTLGGLWSEEQKRLMAVRRYIV